MIKWYKDDEIGIFFSEQPEVLVRYSNLTFNNDEKDKIYQKPFLLKNTIQVLIEDYFEFESYSFSIKSGYTWDGASIPRFFWRILGAKTDNRFLIPSLIHDVLCENHDYIDNQRYLSTIIFERLLYVSQVNPFTRWIMKHSVDNFQKFCSWD